jgi:ubiquinone/menaquinone biosynthesis C-methylase UbiE
MRLFSSCNIESEKPNRIGGEASNIPVSDNFFKAATATCSVEHFESDSDIKFMKEMERVLMRGGKIVIVPLYMFIKPEIQADPKYCLAGDVKFDEDADIYCAKDWGNRYGRHYSASPLFRRLIEPNKNLEFKVYLLGNPEDIHSSVYCRFVLIGTQK